MLQDQTLSSKDRRVAQRVPLEIFLNQYINDRPYRAMAGSMSESGLLLNRVKAPSKMKPVHQVVGLEFELPGTGETIWARGEICSQHKDDYFFTDRVRFTAMPQVHKQLLHDYCFETYRSNLDVLLSQILLS